MTLYCFIQLFTACPKSLKLTLTLPLHANFTQTICALRWRYPIPDHRYIRISLYWPTSAYVVMAKSQWWQRVECWVFKVCFSCRCQYPMLL